MASAHEYLKIISILMMSLKKQGFLSDLKTHFGTFQTVNLGSERVFHLYSNAVRFYY